MADPTALITLASAGTLATMIGAMAVLRGWEGWLDIRRLELRGSGPVRDIGSSKPPGRLEIADLRDRVRRLEAIANGADV